PARAAARGVRRGVADGAAASVAARAVDGERLAQAGRSGGRHLMPSFDPIQFIAEKLRDPATGRPFVLYPEQETFLRLALTPDASGALRFRELVFSTPKKNGKTTFGAIVMLVTVFGLGGPDAEGYCLASDEQQAQSRVYQWCRKIVRSSPSLRAACTVTATKITYLPTGATMTALASDEKGAAGVEPTAAEFEELGTYDAERLPRLFDEMIPIPTKKISIRLTTTHAGFSDSSPVLQRLYERGLRGVQVQPDLYQSDGMLMFWTNRNCAPWITESWLRDAEQQLRPAQYARMIRSEWVSSTSSFIDPAEWDACAVGRPLLSDNTQPVWVGLDASLSRDASAMAAVMYDAADQRIRLVWHRIWQPTKKDRLQFEATIGTAICELMTRFQVRKIRYDPYQ